MDNKTNDKKGKQKIKSIAKAIGLKSTILTDDNYVLVAFDNAKSGDVVRVEDAISKEILLVKDEPIKTKINDNNIWVSNNKMSAKVNKPNIDNVGMDNLKLKGRIEKYVFDEEFPNDNVHIQIAHNVLDVKKILAPYVNDIVGSMNNIVYSPTDVVGIAYSLKNREEQIREGVSSQEKRATEDDFIYNISKYSDFYDGAFQKVPEEKDKNYSQKERILDYNFDVLRLISHVRQCTFHNKNKNENIVYGDAIYNFNKNIPAELVKLVEENYKKDITNVVDSFWKSQGVNLLILNKLYKAETNYKLEKAIIKKLFNFVVKKENKNLGVNITTIREFILNNHIPTSLETKFDSLRSKMYQIYDFIIYDYLITHAKSLNEVIVSLRQIVTEEDKQNIYEEYSNKVWNAVGRLIVQAEDTIYEIGTKGYDSEIDTREYKDVVDELNLELAVPNFVKMIDMLCKFLDKKEINELVTDLINKFDNIADLIDICKSDEVSLDVTFKEDFKLFDNSRQVAQALQVVKSIARMKNRDALVSAKLGLEILGIDKEFANDEKFNQTSNKSDRNTTSIRNFVLNSVIKSKQFKYLIKYVRPKECIKIAQNKGLVSYVVKGLPEKQIQRYYSVLNIKKETDVNVAKDIITNRIVDIYGGKKFQSILENVVSTGKQQAQALVELYLTVVYIFVKNMVKINTSYTIAYYVYERDNFLKLNRKVSYDLAMLESYYDDIKQKNREVLDENIKTFKDNDASYILLAYKTRNAVVHFNCITRITKYIGDIKFDSYYSTYHYILQKAIYERDGEIIDGVESMKCLMDNVDKYKRYSKDLLKLMMLPLAYNQSRYKNLVSEVLYNRYFGWNPEKDNKNNKK